MRYKKKVKPSSSSKNKTSKSYGGVSFSQVLDFLKFYKIPVIAIFFLSMAHTVNPECTEKMMQRCTDAFILLLVSMVEAAVKSQLLIEGVDAARADIDRGLGTLQLYNFTLRSIPECFFPLLAFRFKGEIQADFTYGCGGKFYETSCVFVRNNNLVVPICDQERLNLQ